MDLLGLQTLHNVIAAMLLLFTPAASLRIQNSDKEQFSEKSQAYQGLYEFVFCSLLLFFAAFNFVG